LKPTNLRGIVANGSQVRFKGVGPAFGLEKVYYMPEAKATLISMADLLADNEMTSADGGDTIIFANKADGQESWRFVKEGGLFKLAPTDLAVYSVFTQGALPGQKAMLLHRRFGHASWRQIAAMVKNQCIDGIEQFSAKDLPRVTPHCHGCALGKIRRSPFAKVNPYRSKVPGAGWHVDIITVRIPAVENQGRYYLLFTDDATRTWVGYLMRAKSEACRMFEKFHTDIIKFFGLPMVFLKSDRGGEFTGRRFRDTLLRLGIRQILVTPRDPQLNGGAERQGQTLFGDVRAMLIDSGLPMGFWAHAARYSAYTRNRMPRLRSKDGPFSTTPIEWLTGERPTSKYMKVFGCYCTYYTDSEHKLLPRGQTARFLGISEGRYYILWDPKSQRVMTRTHVQFRERGQSPTMSGEFSAPRGVENAEADKTLDVYEDHNVGVPAAVAEDDIVIAWHDNGIVEPEMEPRTREEVEEVEAREAMPAVPTRDLSAADSHLEHPPADESSLIRWEEITPQPVGTQDSDIGGNVGPDPLQAVEDDEMESDDENYPVEDIPTSQDPSNSAGHHHPLMLRSLGSALTASATAPRDSKRTAPRTGVTFAPAGEAKPAAAAKSQERRKSPPPQNSGKRRVGRPVGSGRHQRAAAAKAAKAQAAGLPPPPTPAPTVSRGRGRPRGTGHLQRAQATLARRQMPHEDVSISNVNCLQLPEEGRMDVDDQGLLADLEGILDRQVAEMSFPYCFAVTDVATDPGVTSEGIIDPRLLSPPLHYRQAHSRPDSKFWAFAEDLEMEGLRNKGVFSWTRMEDLPPFSKVLTTRFVYDFKTNERNEIIKYKARLVVRGFEQRAGIEYNETFSATIRASSVRTLLSVAAHHRLRLRQLDVEQAFLTAGMDGEVIYVRPPPGQERPGHVWLLNKALYGLKQASNLFEKHFADILVNKMGMRRTVKDRALYVPRDIDFKKHPLDLAVGVYVDDCICGYASDGVLDRFRTELFGHIKMKDVGPLRYCLGMHIVQDPENYNISVTQRGFTEDLLTRTGHMNEGEQTRATPTLHSLKLSPADSPSTPAEVAEMNRAPYNTYRSVVGSLMYLTGATRPDIGYAVNVLARHVANPGKPHWRALVHLLRYLRGTMDLGVHYCGLKTQGFILERERRQGLRRSQDDLPNPDLLSESFRNNLIAYADADWGSDLETRRSVSGWVVFLNGGPVAWRVKRQQTVATSSAESELYSLGDCIKELLCLRAMMLDLGMPQPQVRPGRGGATAGAASIKNTGTVVFEDNQGCIQISQKEILHQRTKHVDIQWHFIMETVEAGQISVQPVNTTAQVADLLTKGVTRGILDKLRDKLMGSWIKDQTPPVKSTTTGTRS
jgi:hypothetical protein